MNQTELSTLRVGDGTLEPRQRANDLGGPERVPQGGGRLIDDAKELDRWLDELRQRMLRELDAKHRVRLR